VGADAVTTTTRTITIIVRSSNDFDVHEGERYSGRLCWEELLGQIATMTHPLINAPRFRMDTPEEHAARWARRANDVSEDLPF
jgi:hypothetical protein